MNTGIVFISALLVHGVASVFSVAEKRMTYRRKMSSYLVCAPRQQFDFNEAHIFVFREHAVFCFYFFRTVCLSCEYFDKILLFVFRQPTVQDAFFSFNVPWTTQR